MTDLYSRSYNPIWNLRDLTGLPLDDTYYAFFLENTIPYQPQAVYHTPNGTPWTNPVQVSAAGTLPIDLYFDPNLVYRIEIRAGDTQGDALTWLIENYIPLGDTTPDIITGDVPANMITNPQFSVVNFTNGHSIAIAGTYEIAPGWFLDLSGAGTAVLTQQPITSSDLCATNAPYALRLNLTGWSGAVLRQRFDETGILWSGATISAQCTARLVSGSFPELTSTLYHSTDVPIVALFSGSLVTGTFDDYVIDPFEVATYTNTDIPPDAYVELRINIPNSVIDITSIQISQGSSVIFEQEPVERQVDHMFHYYKPQLEYKPIPSWLVGWDFPLNPAQFNGDSVAAQAVGANKSYYAWDQTILFQTANSAITTSRIGNTGAISLACAVNTQMAMIQYLKNPTAKELLQSAIAVHVAASCSSGAAIDATISLWYTQDATLPDLKTPNFNSLIATLDANGKPATYNGNWVEVPRINGRGDATFTFEVRSTREYPEYMFNGWDLEGIAATGTATYFAIVIGTTAMTVGQSIEFKSVGVCSGDIATRPAPQAVDEALRECRRYWETSYAPGVTIGTALAGGSLLYPMLNLNVGNDNTPYPRSFGIIFKEAKINNAPQVKFYSPINGAADFVFTELRTSGNVVLLPVTSQQNTPLTTPPAAATGLWTETYKSATGAQYMINSNAAIHPAYVGSGNAATFPEVVAYLHYTCDSRLGIIL